MHATDTAHLRVVAAPPTSDLPSGLARLASVFLTYSITRVPRRASPPHGGETLRAEPRKTAVLSVRVPR